MKVTLIMAMTADGKIARHAEHEADWTSAEDKKMFREATKKAGVIVMGKTTYDTIGHPLPGRLNIVLTSKPDTDKNIPGLLEYTDKNPNQLLDELQKRGFQSIILGGGATINGLFLKANLIDEMWLTVEPKIFGNGIPLFNGAEVNSQMTLMEIKRLSDNALQLRYRVNK